MMALRGMLLCSRLAMRLRNQKRLEAKALEEAKVSDPVSGVWVDDGWHPPGDSNPAWRMAGETEDKGEKDMTKRTLSIVAALALAIAAGVPTFAQDLSVHAHVPFAFSVSNSTFPAGDYALSELSQNTWVVRTRDGKRAITAAARPDGINTDESLAKLVFKKYGERYFLSKVWCAGLTTEIAEPKEERAIEIQMTSKNQKPETVFVLASNR